MPPRPFPLRRRLTRAWIGREIKRHHGRVGAVEAWQSIGARTSSPVLKSLPSTSVESTATSWSPAAIAFSLAAAEPSVSTSSTTRPLQSPLFSTKPIPIGLVSETE